MKDRMDYLDMCGADLISLDILPKPSPGSGVTFDAMVRIFPLLPSSHSKLLMLSGFFGGGDGERKIKACLFSESCGWVHLADIPFGGAEFSVGMALREERIVAINAVKTAVQFAALLFGMRVNEFLGVAQ